MDSNRVFTVQINVRERSLIGISRSPSRRTLPPTLARFMAISQVPISVEAFGAKATASAWSKKFSYTVVARQDRMINPDLERFMTGRAKSETIELPGSHAIFSRTRRKSRH